MGATCCVRLATQLRCVATCWVLKIELVGMPGCHIAAEPGEKTTTSINIYNYCIKKLTILKTWVTIAVIHNSIDFPSSREPNKRTIYVHGAKYDRLCVFVTGTIVCRKLSGLIRGRTLECVSVWTCRWLGSHFCFCIRPRQHYVGEI